MSLADESFRKKWELLALMGNYAHTVQNWTGNPHPIPTSTIRAAIRRLGELFAEYEKDPMPEPKLVEKEGYQMYTNFHDDGPKDLSN